MGVRRAEIIVVDNGSVDGSVEMLRDRAGVELLELGENTGFTYAANAGAAKASGALLLFLNPDIVAPPGSLDALAAALEERSDAWAVTPWFLNPDGTPQYFWRRIPGAGTTALALTQWGRRFDRAAGSRMKRFRSYGSITRPRRFEVIDGVGAACLLMRRAEFEGAGRFDERYRNFFQDAELERTMLARGRLMLGIGDISVFHEGGASLKVIPEHEIEGMFLHDLRIFLAGSPWYHRVVAEAAIRTDLALPGRGRAVRRRHALRPLP